MDPLFFETQEAFRAWLDEHHATTSEQWIGLWRKGSGKPSITMPQAVEVALCYGWIDGQGKRIDEERYMVRFTPRKPNSAWSAVNLARYAKLAEQGLIAPAGERAFAQRKAERSGVYSYEQARDEVKLDEAYAAQLAANPAASAFFQAQRPSYQRAIIWWIMSAKRAETQHKRLATLIEESAAGRTVRQFTRSKR